MAFSCNPNRSDKHVDTQSNEMFRHVFSKLNIVPITLQTQMNVKEFLKWANKEEAVQSDNRVNEINAFSGLKMSLTEGQSSEYNFAFQIRQSILPVGCVSLYLVNHSDQNVKIFYKLRCLGKSDNKILVHSVAEGICESMDRQSSLYLDDFSIESLQDAIGQINERRPIGKLPTGKLAIICDILVLCNTGSSAQKQYKHTTYSESLILYL